MKSKYLVFVGMGMELVGVMLASLYLGQKLDEHYHLQGLGIAVLSICGLAGWLVHIIMLAKALEKRSSANDSEK